MDYFTETMKKRRLHIITSPKLLLKKAREIRTSRDALLETMSELENKIEEIAEMTAKLQIIEAELEKTKEFSFIDCLTGCYNRNYFNKYIKDHFDKNRDHNRIGIVMADINDLKKINDKHGHEAGDALIRNSAETLREIFRKDDIVVRLGGDEFVVICTNFHESPNFEIELKNAVYQKLSRSRITMAFGVAVFNELIDESISDTVARADELMYENKKSHKDYLARIDTVTKRRDFTVRVSQR